MAKRTNFCDWKEISRTNGASIRCSGRSLPRRAAPTVEVVAAAFRPANFAQRYDEETRPPEGGRYKTVARLLRLDQVVVHRHRASVRRIRLLSALSVLGYGRNNVMAAASAPAKPSRRE